MNESMARDIQQHIFGVNTREGADADCAADASSEPRTTPSVTGALLIPDTVGQRIASALERIADSLDYIVGECKGLAK